MSLRAQVIRLAATLPPDQRKLLLATVKTASYGRILFRENASGYIVEYEGHELNLQDGRSLKDITATEKSVMHDIKRIQQVLAKFGGRELPIYNEVQVRSGGERTISFYASFVWAPFSKENLEAAIPLLRDYEVSSRAD